MYRAIIVPIGSEILSGAVVDTNSAFLSKELSSLAFEVVKHVAVQDQTDPILKVLKQSFKEVDLIILTGGLGPTFDDITKKVLSEFFQRPLVFMPRQFRRIRNYFHTRKRKPHTFSRIQACFPTPCHIFDNNFGVAPGIGLEDQKRWVIALPGVPREMEGMFRHEVIPFLKKKFRPSSNTCCLYSKVIQLNEVEILKKLGKKFPPKDGTIDCGIYPATGEVTLRMKFRGNDKPELQKKVGFWKKFMIKRLGKFLIGFNEDPLEKTLGDLLIKKHHTLSLAESVTGGLIAKRLTDIKGASKFLLGGVVAYSNRAKENLLGVPSRIIRQHSQVSIEVAREMARRVRSKFGTTWGMAATGVAGPSSGGAGESVGTVFIGLSSEHKTLAKRYQFYGGREKIRWLASQTALAMLREKILYG